MSAAILTPEFGVRRGVFIVQRSGGDWIGHVRSCVGDQLPERCEPGGFREVLETMTNWARLEGLPVIVLNSTEGEDQPWLGEPEPVFRARLRGAQ